jgi:hypothetical protein
MNILGDSNEYVYKIPFPKITLENNNPPFRADYLQKESGGQVNNRV